MLFPSQQIHKLQKKINHIFLQYILCTFISYIMTKIWKRKVCIATKYKFSCFNCGISRNGQSITVCAPYWFEGQGVILEQEVYSTTPFTLSTI